MRRIGDLVGPIRLVEHLGTGGMGDIFVGIDERLDRRVAIKAIRPEHLSLEVRERLVREARLLSTFDHENICRIYELIEDGDETFLVLELIPGRNLRQVLESGLDRQERLRIAEKIALTLEVAHRRGIIHRDLKLENVMLRDDGVIKVLDFGVARSLTEPPPSEAPRIPSGPPSGSRDSSLTVLGEAVGTLTSMSPEQARGEVVTPASDLYSLGLLLREWLTGTPPYPLDLSQNAIWLRAKEGDVAPVEGLDSATTSLIRDLLTMNPDDRPNASEALARLRAIRERPRRRVRMALAAALLFLALLGAAKYTVDLRRERNAAVEAKREAERKGRESEAVVELMTGLFEASDPGQAKGRDPRASELLDRGSETIRSALEEQPLVRARMMETIGRVSRMLGQTGRAESLLLEALELRAELQQPDHPDLAQVRSDYGELLTILGRFDEAEQQLERALGILERTGAPAIDSVETINRLGAVGLATGKFEEAVAHFRSVIEIGTAQSGADDMRVIASRNNLAIALLQLGRFDEAGREHEAVLEARRRVLGTNHPDVGTSLNNLAVVRYSQGRYQAAEELMSEALGIWTEVFGENHPEVATANSNLGELALARGDLAAARGRFEEASRLWRAAFGDDHPDLAYAWHGLGHVAKGEGDPAAAEAAYREALRLRAASLTPNHPDLIQVRADLEALRP